VRRDVHADAGNRALLFGALPFAGMATRAERRRAPLKPFPRRADASCMKTPFREAKRSTKIATVIFWLLALYMLAVMFIH
jgi:hypothetical protein